MADGRNGSNRALIVAVIAMLGVIVMGADRIKIAWFGDGEQDAQRFLSQTNYHLGRNVGLLRSELALHIENWKFWRIQIIEMQRQLRNRPRHQGIELPPKPKARPDMSPGSLLPDRFA